jgi:hypothetical protein
MCAQWIQMNRRNGLARVRESRYVAVTRRLLRHFLKASMGCRQGLGATSLGLDNFEARFVSNILSVCGMYISYRNSAAELGSNFVLHVTSRQIELR